MVTRPEDCGQPSCGLLIRARKALYAARCSSSSTLSSPRAGFAAEADADESVDDDEHLAAYNAYLARLNEHNDR